MVHGCLSFTICNHLIENPSLSSTLLNSFSSLDKSPRSNSVVSQCIDRLLLERRISYPRFIFKMRLQGNAAREDVLSHCLLCLLGIPISK